MFHHRLVLALFSFPFRGALGAVLTGSLLGTTLIAHASTEAENFDSAVSGTFSVGGGISGGINPQTGAFETGVPVVSLAGLDTPVDLSLSYHHGLAVDGIDQVGAGTGWTWNLPSVDTHTGLTVRPASGGEYEADEQTATGLSRYPLEDLKFTQEKRDIPARLGLPHVSTLYSLEYEGGKDFFDHTGALRSRFSTFGQRTDFVWNEQGCLTDVIDNAGNRATLTPIEEGISVTTSPRSDGHVATTTLSIEDQRLHGITSPGEQSVAFAYHPEHSGLVLDTISTSSGTRTAISYDEMAGGVLAAKKVVVSDERDGTELSTREWNIVGEHTSAGYPDYENSSQLWDSGDNAYRYTTVVGDGKTKLTSHYNSMGLLVDRDLAVSISGEDTTIQKQAFVYDGTQSGGVPRNNAVPAQYAKPVRATTTYLNAHGRARTATEETEYDRAGRVVTKKRNDGTVEEFVYNTVAPVANDVPGGLGLPLGFTLEHTTRGTDGTATKTTTSLDTTRRSIAATETLHGASLDDLASRSRVSMSIDPQGFVTEQKLVNTNPGLTQGPQNVTTRFERSVDAQAKTATVWRISAAGSDAQYTTSVTSDVVTGLPLSETDPVGRRTVTEYDAAGRPTTFTDFVGETTVTHYGDRVTATTDPRGVTTTQYADAAGRPVRVVDNLVYVNETLVPRAGIEREQETRRYEDDGSTVVVTDALGRETIAQVDPFGRVKSTYGPTGILETTSYDDVANTTTTSVFSDGLAKTTNTMTRDDSGRPTRLSTTRGDGVGFLESQIRYDGLGRPTEKTVGDISATYSYRNDGTPRSSTLASHNQAEFPGEALSSTQTVDMSGTATNKTVSNDRGDTASGWTRILDAAGRTREEITQSGVVTSYSYTTDGLVESTRNSGTGVSTSNNYDPTTRELLLSERSNASETSRRGYEYDRSGNLTAVFDADDRVETEITYTHDLAGNVTSINYPDGKRISHVYDEHGRTARTTDIEGNKTHFHYDALGFLANAKQTDRHGNELSAVAYAYDDFGRTKEITRGNGVVTRYTFTSLDEIVTEETRDETGTLLFGGSYEYDAHGNVSTATTRQLLPGGNTTTKSVHYRYNSQDQLVASDEYAAGTGPSSNPAKTTRYTIGISGNVQEQVISENGVTTARQFTTNELGQTTSITTNGAAKTQTYDAVGNLLESSDGTRYTYNIDNQPISATRDGATYETHYWSNGQRKSHTKASVDDSETTQFYWDGGTILNDVHHASSSDSRSGSYFVAATRLARSLETSNGTTNDYYVADRHGSIRATTTSSGQVTTGYEYSDYGVTAGYGEKSGSERNAFQYSGEYSDWLGTQELGDRTYTPETMSFTTRDTASMFNRYAYVDSNPISYVDPSGQTAAHEQAIAGVLLSVGVVAAVASFGALYRAAQIGASSFVQAGFGFAGLTELGDAAIGAAFVAEQSTAEDLIRDDREQHLGWAGLAIAVAGMVTSLFSAAGGLRVSHGRAPSRGAATTQRASDHDTNTNLAVDDGETLDLVPRPGAGTAFPAPVGAPSAGAPLKSALRQAGRDRGAVKKSVSFDETGRQPERVRKYRSMSPGTHLSNEDKAAAFAAQGWKVRSTSWGIDKKYPDPMRKGGGTDDVWDQEVATHVAAALNNQQLETNIAGFVPREAKYGYGPARPARTLRDQDDYRIPK